MVARSGVLPSAIRQTSRVIPAAEVAACLVTRGDVDMEPVLASLRPVFDEIRIYDNSQRTDRTVLGRYIAVSESNRLVSFVQDDDVILPETSIRALLEAYEPGRIVANMPERFRQHYPDSCLVGFGAVFDTDLPQQAFRRMWNEEPQYLEVFWRTCDVVFTSLTPRILLDLDYADREFASAPNRMWKQPNHVGERKWMLDLARQVRDGR